MLKPVDAGELSRVFQKVHDALDQEFDEKQSIHRLKNYYLESLPILQESFYTSLIEGDSAPAGYGKYTFGLPDFPSRKILCSGNFT